MEKMNKVNRDPWKKINSVSDSCVGLDGLNYLIKIFYEKFKYYLKLIEVVPTTEEEAAIKSNELHLPYFELLLYQELAEIIACTTIESLVNSAGIHVFSEKYYKKNVERSNILSKQSIMDPIIWTRS